ncbi:hypothetical protein EXW39_17830 [Bacillus mycoides]|nr:hypothetical protein EXW39_17830 [Bacillus mycoides]TKI31133.1 hypothetical protein FC700_28405 [Bacillus mycoides]
MKNKKNTSIISKKIDLMDVFLHTGVTPHCHQPKLLRYPHTEIFTFLQLFMRIQLIFSFWGTINFLS